ncbi:thiamine phosphate synthase [Nocardioides litoris]|uniref:thiamine phosphate synthase n=1 Tax=Nocardioides litoris TaxID=1926648 RepID=UPI0011243579|nr:thiamine phosphate synthase [Nocardioides litoris]
MRPLDPTLYVVTDTAQCGGPDRVVATVAAAVAGGATAVQLRDPGSTTRDLVALAEALLAVTRPAGVPLVVNDRVDVALAVGADGAHVGQSDLDPVRARRLLGPEAHLGLSVSTPAQARAAAALPPGTVDLLGVGPLRATSTKPDAAPPFGPAGLAALCAASTLPCVVIGGVTAADAAPARAAGAAGLAVVSAVCGAASPADAAAELVAAWHDARGAA